MKLMHKNINIFILALILCLGSSAFAQKKVSQKINWDLSYKSILEKNNVDQDAFLSKWLAKIGESPAKKLISDWQSEHIISSVLIEQPNFHNGDRVTIWYVRTENDAYLWELYEGKPPRYNKKPIDTKLYDRMFEEIAAWKQAKPLSEENKSSQTLYGYIGFLSIYHQGNSRQMLLTMEDFFLTDKNKKDDVKPGRMQIMDSIFSSISN